MTPTRTYPHGVPCWIDTEQPDQGAARDFYATLFGWTFFDAMPPDAPGSYLIAQLDGRDVAGIGAATGSTAEWNTYVAVVDADEIAALAERVGGRVTRAPEDAGPGGRSASFVDPTGAAFRTWQARKRPGAQAVNAPGAWNFSDLHTTDVDLARKYYFEVFGWEADDLDLGNGESAIMWRRPGYGQHLAATVDPDIFERQAGVSAPPGFADAIAWLAPVETGEPSHWHVTFTVDDRDEMVAAAERLGASALSGPIDSTWTKSAVIRDPQGAVFTVSQFTPPTP